jgi:hypothetical protein
MMNIFLEEGYRFVELEEEITKQYVLLTDYLILRHFILEIYTIENGWLSLLHTHPHYYLTYSSSAKRHVLFICEIKNRLAVFPREVKSWNLVPETYELTQELRKCYFRNKKFRSLIRQPPICPQARPKRKIHVSER